MAMTPSGGEPRWLISGYSATYKIGTNDSLWGYHAVTEKDTGSKLLIEYGFGELALDNGNGMTPFDLLDREDTLAIDSLHPKEYFMQSVNFTLPAGGTVQYCPWIRPSDASLYQSRFDTLIYALDFYDTSGAYQFRIDSIALCDSSERIRSILRTISINRDNDKLGYTVFHRVTGFMADSEAMPQNIITQKRLSTISSYKQRTGAQHPASAKNDITLVTAPNPFKGEVNVYLGIPEPGLVTIEAYNALGNTMGYLCKDRLFTNGMHQLVWKAGKLPSGIYILRMRFGNETVSARIIAIE